MSNGLVLSFLRRPSNSDWTQQELAEFYRVEGALLQGGFAVTTDRGLTDEGDPWFVVCRADNEEVIAHFARIDREYVIVSNLHAEAARGRDFRALVREMLDSHPLTLPMRRSQGQKVFLHPAALLTALLASAYVLSTEKELAGDGVSSDGHSKSTSIASLLMQKFSVFAAAALAATWLEHQAESAINAFENAPLLHSPNDGKATHVAVTHDAAPLDIVTQTVQGIELGAHRNDSGKQAWSLADGGGQEIVAPWQTTNPNAQHNTTSDKGDPNTATSFDHTNDVHIAYAYPDAAQVDRSNIVPSNLETAVSVAAIATELAAGMNSQASTENVQGVSSTDLTVATEAFHLAASEIGTFSTQAVLLSSEPVPLEVALQQTFLQAGFGTNLLNNLDAGSANGAVSTSFADAGTSNSNTPVHTGIEWLTIPTASAAAANPSSQANTVTQVATSTSQVAHSVETFLQNTPAFEITLAGANVIIIDTNVADAKSPNFGVMTWDMSDGSTLSIVGIIPSHAHTVTA